MRLGISARVVARLYENGELVEERETRNFLTDLGAAYIADRLSDRDETDGDISHFAIGSGSGQDRTSTTLATEEARVALESGYPDQLTGTDDHIFQWKADFPTGTPATDKTISEGALFSTGPTGGTMINYIIFDPPIDKITTRNLVVDVYWEIGG